jgi:hypothetical protein
MARHTWFVSVRVLATKPMTVKALTVGPTSAPPRCRIRDEGRVEVATEVDHVLFAHGPHPLLEDFFGTFGKLCDAFAELGA